MTSTTKLTAARCKFPPISAGKSLINSIMITDGKDLVRVFRIVRGEKWQEVVEYTVCCLLEGAIEEAYTKADNASIVATDSIKVSPYQLVTRKAVFSNVVKWHRIQFIVSLLAIQLENKAVKSDLQIMPKFRKIF